MRITLVGAAIAVFGGAVVAILSFNSDGRLERLPIAIIASLALGAAGAAAILIGLAWLLP